MRASHSSFEQLHSLRRKSQKHEGCEQRGGGGLYGTLSDPGALGDPESVQNCSSSGSGTCTPISAEQCRLRMRSKRTENWFITLILK